MKKYGFLIIVIGVIGIMVALFAIGNRSSTTPSTPPATVRNSPDGLPGLLTSTAPWSNNTDQLAERLAALSLPKLGAEGTVLHIHQHLDIYVDGTQVPVPSSIGIPTTQSFIATIHSHNSTGVMHVESPTQQDFYLGQVFDVWGVKFDANDLGGYKTDAAKQLVVYINGAKQSGDPRKLKLDAHQEIVIAYGTQSELPATIPASYQFAKNE